MIDLDTGFTLTRELDATPEAIWAAWTTPEQAAEWWHPVGMHTPADTVTIDARVGGRYRYTMVDDTSGETYPTGGVYREVDPGSRLVFTWGVPEGDPGDTPLVTVEIASLGELSRLTFRLQGVDGMSGDDSYYDGWESALDELVRYLGQTSVAG